MYSGTMSRSDAETYALLRAITGTAAALGGETLGAAAGLLCGPGAPVCSPVFAIGAGFGSEIAAIKIFDAQMRDEIEGVQRAYYETVTLPAWEEARSCQPPV